MPRLFLHPPMCPHCGSLQSWKEWDNIALAPGEQHEPVECIRCEKYFKVKVIIAFKQEPIAITAEEVKKELFKREYYGL